MSTIRFRPSINVDLDSLQNDGTLQYQVDWGDCCEGGFDDEDDGIGYPDECDQAWTALMELFQRHPVMMGYPTAYIGGQIVLVDNPAADPEVLHRIPGLGVPRPLVQTCAFYSPAQTRIEAEGAIPLEKWPFGKHFPYGVCTNPAVVGNGGFGPCRVDHPHKMNQCGAYLAEPLVRRGDVTRGPLQFVLESGRGGQGLALWKLTTRTQGQEEDTVLTWTGAEAETQAREAWTGVAGEAPLEAIEKQAKPFIKSLVGACHGTGG